MKLPFDFPPLEKGSSQPVWTGSGFMVDGELKPVLDYSSNIEGWDDDLTYFQESSAGSDHRINIASRRYALGQLKKHVKKDFPVILEIGCSSGYMLQAMQKSFPKALILGSDSVSGPLNKIAIESRGIPLIQFDLVKCPLPDTSVDVVVLLNVLEHIQDDLSALHQVNRILKPGGIAILEVPAGTGLYDVYDELLLHLRRYSLPGLNKLSRDAGFEIVRTSHLGFFAYPAFWLTKKRNQHFLKGANIKPEKIVEQNIRKTRSNLLLNILLSLELALGKYLKYPFGIRCLMTCVKPNTI